MAKIQVERDGLKFEIEEDQIGKDGEFLSPPSLVKSSDISIEIEPLSLLNSLSEASFIEVLGEIETNKAFSLFFNHSKVTLNNTGKLRTIALINLSGLGDSAKAELIGVLENS